MTGDRSKRLLNNVRRTIGKMVASQETTSEAIYDALTRIQRRIAEECMCLETSTTLTVSSGVVPFPEDMISERIIVSDGALPIQKINMDKVELLKRQASSMNVSDVLTDLVTSYARWDDGFIFLTSTGLPPTTEHTVTLYYWRTPDSTISSTADPLVKERWDTALWWGAVADLSMNDQWEAKFQREFSRQKNRERTMHGEVLEVIATGDYD